MVKGNTEGEIFMHKIFKDEVFFKTLFSIALPITLQNLIGSSLNMVDTVMVGELGESQVAAVGLANQLFFLLSLVLFGINSGSSIFISQFWGKKDVANIRRVLGIALLTGGVFSFIFTAIAFFSPGFVLRLFSEDAYVIELGSGYLRIVSLSYVITGISFAYGFASRSIGQAKLPMIVSAVSLGCNTILNYLLIFGKFGFPEMGVDGAALATLIARIVEVVLMTMIIYRKGYALAGRLRELLDLSMVFVIKFFKTTIPVILNEGFWALGMTMYSAAYARISTGAVAAVQISNTIQNLFMVIFFGMGNACAVMIGNKIGANDKDTAIDYAKKYSIIGPALGLIMGALLVVLAPKVMILFNVSAEVQSDVYRILTVLAIFMGIKVFNILLVVGILRSGGDTKFSMFLEIGSVWLVGVPLAFLGSIVWRLPIYWVIALVSIEELLKASVGIPRVVSKRWVRNVVDHM